MTQKDKASPSATTVTVRVRLYNAIMFMICAVMGLLGLFLCLHSAGELLSVDPAGPIVPLWPFTGIIGGIIITGYAVLFWKRSRF